MSNEDNNKMMNPAAFEAFIKELTLNMKGLDISNKQTVDFFNEAIRTVKSSFPNAENLEEMEEPEEDDRPWIDQEDQ